jgi:hypothetical protein
MRLDRIALTAALALSASAAGAPEFNPSDYAYGAPLAIDGRSAVYVVPFSQDVYRVATRPDLGDVAVVNGADEVVPFAIRRPSPPPEAAPATIALPLFPLEGPGNLPGDALRLRLRSGTTSVDIDQPATARAASAPTAYLIDARQVGEPLSRLHLNWAADAPDFSVRYSIDWSSDLVRWLPIGPSAAVVNLHFAGQAFERADIDLPGFRAQFLRLTWAGSTTPVALTGVSGEHRRPRTEAIRFPALAHGTASAVAGEYEFDLGARLPLDRLNLGLPEDNTLADVEFLARDSTADAWRSIVHGRLYRLAVAGAPDLTSPPLAIAATPARYWKVRISAAGGGIGRAPPELSGGWLPDELLFVARGRPPFRLLYGNASAPPLAVAPAALTVGGDTAAAEPRALAPGRAALAAAVEVGGRERLAPVVPAPDWKRWLLWAVLVLGVAMLARMAFRLSRAL